MSLVGGRSRKINQRRVSESTFEPLPKGLNRELRAMTPRKKRIVTLADHTPPPQDRSKYLSIRGSCQRLHRESPRRRQLQFNKWYISPRQRCLQKPDDMKGNYRAYQDNEYFYKNLHNTRFWNWKHPLASDNSTNAQPQRTKTHPDILKNKVFKKVLQGFKRKLDNSHRRLPNIVRQILDS